jgi:hypothetical protein
MADHLEPGNEPSDSKKSEKQLSGHQLLKVVRSPLKLIQNSANYTKT